MDNNNTAIFLDFIYGAIVRGEINAVKECLDMMSFDLNPLLRIAVTMNQPNIVSLLLDKGANAAQTNNTKKTILREAVRLGYLDIIKMLVEHSLELLNQTDSYYWSPLDFALIRGDKTIYNFLHKKGAYHISPLIVSGRYMVVANRLVETSRQEEERIRQIHAQYRLNEQSNDFLCVACAYADTAVIDLLLASVDSSRLNVADLEFKDKKGRTPLYWALVEQPSNDKLRRLLLQEGAKITPEVLNAANARKIFLFDTIFNNSDDGRYTPDLRFFSILPQWKGGADEVISFDAYSPSIRI
jgi:ankyrin repeat protein